MVTNVKQVKVAAGTLSELATGLDNELTKLTYDEKILLVTIS